jgi:hypothetical protein
MPQNCKKLYIYRKEQKKKNENEERRKKGIKIIIKRILIAKVADRLNVVHVHIICGFCAVNVLVHRGKLNRRVANFCKLLSSSEI